MLSHLITLEPDGPLFYQIADIVDAKQCQSWQNPDIGEIQVIWLLAAQSLIIYVLVIYLLLLKAHCWKRWHFCERGRHFALIYLQLRPRCLRVFSNMFCSKTSCGVIIEYYSGNEVQVENKLQCLTLCLSLVLFLANFKPESVETNTKNLVILVVASYFHLKVVIILICWKLNYLEAINWLLIELW